MSVTEWKLEREVWVQSEAGFRFASRDGKARSTSWSEDALALILGAKARSRSCTPDSECGQHFPSAFEYCPSCGGKLVPPSSRNPQAWLPPFGNHVSRATAPSGLRLTETRLTVVEPIDPRARPHVELPKPRGGSFQFVVGALAEKGPGLLGIDAASGDVYALTSVRTWTPLEPSGSTRLAECSLPSSGWQMASGDLSATNRFWVPTDHGLCAVDADVPSLSYGAEYVTGACIGAPVACSGHLIVPCEGDESSISLAFRPSSSMGMAWQSISVEIDSAKATRFASAVSTGRRSIWEATNGHLHVFVAPTGNLAAEFVRWPSGFTPWFELGSPYRDKQGNFWRQCRDANERVHFVKLSKSPEIWETDGPRFSTGGLSFRQGVVILERDNPWDEVHAEAEAAAKVVIPLVEHDSEDIAVCAEVDWTSGVGRLLSSQEKVKGRFALRGKLNRDILNFDMKRPWEASAFVWNGHLHLYHPDFDSIPGWRLA